MPGIHGLRGIAALAVVLFHLVHLANIAVPQSFQFIAADFGKGVHLFFVLSAFSLMHSTAHTMHRPAWATEYFVKRFFRIAPLFYVILGAMILWPLIKSQTWAFDFKTVLLNLTFTFGLAPWTGIVWAGWTIGVEMLFYAVLPVLLLTVRTRSATRALVLMSILVTYAARSALYLHYEYSVSHYGYNWAYFSFPANLCFFTFGIYAFWLSRDMNKDAPAMRIIVPVFSIALLAILMVASLDTPLKMIVKGDVILWGIGFAGLALWQSTRPSIWSANRVLEYIGERSYSVYLLHPIVIVLLKHPIQQTYSMLSPNLGAYAYFVCAALVLAPLLVLAEATYRIVEVPGIKFGQKLNRKIRSKTA